MQLEFENGDIRITNLKATLPAESKFKSNMNSLLKSTHKYIS